MSATSQSAIIKTIGMTLLLCSALFGALASAAESSVTPAAAAAASYSPVGQIMKMIVGLVIVLIMIFAVAWLARNYMGFNPSSNAALKPLAGVLVGQIGRAHV